MSERVGEIEKSNGRSACVNLANERFSDAQDIMCELAEDQESLRKHEILDKMIEMGNLANDAKQLYKIIKLIV